MPEKSSRNKRKKGYASIPLSLSISMIFSYACNRISVQLKAVAFLVFFLAGFQVLVVRRPLPDAAAVALGIGGVILGLSFFLEGLLLGVMPLGERCGLHVPARTGRPGILVFSLIVGAAATVAEPAIVFLRAQSGSIEPWQEPMLFLLLNRGSLWLIGSIAAGVGIAVAYGVFRFLMGWSLKPFLFVLIPVLMLISYFACQDTRMSSVLGLAWDTGGVTTGPVTVPLIIALGVGVSRFTGKGNNEFGGLGVVTAASAIPVLAVILLMFTLAPKVPEPMSAGDFFSRQNRDKASFIIGSEEELKELAYRKLSADLFAMHYPEDTADNESAELKNELMPAASSASSNGIITHKSVWIYILDAVKALVPLSLVLFIILRLVKPGSIDRADEIILGLVFAVTGMFLFSWGMENGLDVLGRQAGRSLPEAYTIAEKPDEAKIFTDIDESMIIRGAGPEGITEILIVVESGKPVLYPFDRTRYDIDQAVYRHVPLKKPLLSYAPRWAGFAAVLAFVFALGFGATLAEPSLKALGSTIEELSTGTYRQSFLVRTVAFGVGLGMAAGFARILFDLSLIWVLGIPYTAALLLTAFSSEEFVTVAWDSAGVTTGPLTVPLVLAAGLGVGEASGAAGSFGVVASASVFPILTVLVTGLIKGRKKSAMHVESVKKIQEVKS